MLLSNDDLVYEVKSLARKMDAVILAHYYQDEDIQEVADYIGDSLELSRKAADVQSKYIIFCGVRFMAEVAKIVNPDKIILLPDINATCSLDISCPAAKFSYFRNQYPDHVSVTYINCSAEVKALSDVVVTSSCAEVVINNIPMDKKILFAPDKYLGKYLIKQTGRDMVLWDGSCVVHERFSMQNLLTLKIMHKDAKIIAHPECKEEILEKADFVGSTSALVRYVQKYSGCNFIVATEPGIHYKFKLVSPESKFYFVSAVSDNGCNYCNDCPYMKMNTMEKLYKCMINQVPRINLDHDLLLKAQRSINKMFEMSVGLRK